MTKGSFNELHRLWSMWLDWFSVIMVFSLSALWWRRIRGLWKLSDRRDWGGNYFLGSKITADGDCSHEFKKHLLLGRKVVNNLNSILKSRDITLSTKVHLVKALVFPVVMYGCKSWTIKKADRWRMDSFDCGVGEDFWESHALQGDTTS